MISERLRNTAYQSAQSGLVGCIVHELNNLLTAVGLRMRLLLSQIPEKDPRKPKLRTIESDMERMGDLVNSAFQIAELNEGQLSFLNIREEMERVLELIRFHLLTHDLGVERDFSSKLPLIPGDCQQLRRLFFHLFIRVIGESERGGAVTVRLCVEKRRGRGGGDYLVVEIKGDGQGSPQTAEPDRPIALVRERASREWPAVLALCKSITKWHRGTLTIGAGSGVKSGATIRIALPVVSSC
jgi:signal transduction histidine kinase